MEPQPGQVASKRREADANSTISTQASLTSAGNSDASPAQENMFRHLVDFKHGDEAGIICIAAIEVDGRFLRRTAVLLGAGVVDVSDGSGRKIEGKQVARPEPANGTTVSQCGC